MLGLVDYTKKKDLVFKINKFLKFWVVMYAAMRITFSGKKIILYNEVLR